MFDFGRLDQMLNRVRALREPELVLLNGHLVIERMMFEVAAFRLRCTESEVPHLGFRGLIHLAFRDDVTAKPVMWLNELRNAMAHQFEALESPRFRELIGLFQFPWPFGALDRATVLQLVIYDVQRVLFERMIDEIERDAEPYRLDDWDPEQHEVLKESSNLASEMVTVSRRLIDAGNWDSVVNVLKPGWRPPHRLSG